VLDYQFKHGSGGQTLRQLCSRTSSLYRSIWPASLDQLTEIFSRSRA
jgi:hypothetical protein